MKNNMEQFEKFSMLEHKDTVTSADTPQMIFGEHQITVLEISDEDIEAYIDKNFIFNNEGNWQRKYFKAGAVWYHEQLKQLNEK